MDRAVDDRIRATTRQGESVSISDDADRSLSSDLHDQQNHALNLVSDSVVAVDTRGRITYLNHAAEELSGWTSVELVGRVARTTLFAASKSTFDTAWREVWDQGEWRGTITQCAKSGVEHLVESHWSAVYDEQSSKITSVLMVSTEALKGVRPESTRSADDDRHERRQHSNRGKRGRPQRRTAAPLGNLVLTAIKLLGLTYKDVVSESERLARLNNNPDMRIGKSTLGNVISGSIRQPGTAKLDSLRIILNLSRADMDAAIGLQPERRLAEQLEMSRARTHEIPIDAVTRHRRIKVPILRDDAKLEETQFLEGLVKRWANVEVEYLGAFYQPHLSYVMVGEEDTNAFPIAPPGSRLLVNKLLNKVQPANNVSFHERELFYVLTPNGFTCVYVELAPGEKIVLIPHPASGNVREEFDRDEVVIIGEVVGVLYPSV